MEQLQRAFGICLRRVSVSGWLGSIVLRLVTEPSFTLGAEHLRLAIVHDSFLCLEHHD
jgi:hypothetical protein